MISTDLLKPNNIKAIYMQMVRICIFWLLYFYTSKTIFLAYQWDKTVELSISDIIKAYYHGTALDLSIAGYSLALSFLLSISGIFSQSFATGAIRWLHYILIPAFSVLQIANLELYRNWGFHIDTTPLLYISTPKEMLASVPLTSSLLLVIAAAGLSSAAIYVFNKAFKPQISEKHKPINALILLFSAAAMIIPIRGGVGIVSINSGSVYFSNSLYANHLAVNPIWNFQYSISKHSKLSQGFQFMENPEAEQLASAQSDSTPSPLLLNNQRPNIVVIVLESFTAKLIGSLGGEKGITPKLDSLSKEGIYFTNVYSSGDRSDKGLVAIFSGVPALPNISVNKFPQKTEHFSSLVRSLEHEAYTNSFAYGGNINFANLKSYLSNIGFQDFISKEDFSSEYYSSKWGVHDHVMFDSVYKNIAADKGRYLKAFFTLSNHEPFDVPRQNRFGDDEENRFRNSMNYTDSCLGDFFAKVKQLPSWDSSLYILVADHGARMPGQSKQYDTDRYHIPMLWLGGAIKKDTTITMQMSQFDIPASLLSQLNIAHDEFSFSSNVFASGYSPRAYFAFNNGYGYLNNNITIARDNDSGQFYKYEGPIQVQDSLRGLAYMQSTWNYFMGTKPRFQNIVADSKKNTPAKLLP